ncbi:MAG TPA: hypothetical protein VJZ26_04690 [Blastocatellia bacterium]|nr:hypothetical protein [Blastocatellia bacterium]
MVTRTRIIFISLLLLMIAVSAGAQTGRVALKPNIKAGQESRYEINASVHTLVTPKGAGGIASDVRREVAATVVVRTSVNEKGGVLHEATIESINTRASVDGVDNSSPAAPLADQKIEFVLDDSGRVTKCSIPQKAVDAGLAELIFSLTSWIPSADVSVGQSWGSGAPESAASGEYGYISTTKIADISKGAATTYRLAGVEANKAVIEGAIALNQSGGSVLTTKDGRMNVNVLATGKGSTRVEYDLEGSRIINATTDTTLEGRLVNVAPTREGEKMQPREGSLVETSKFSIKLLK